MKVVLLILTLSILTFAKDISGAYIVKTIIKDGKTKHPNVKTEFKNDGKYYLMGAPMGQWKMGKGNTIYLNTAFEPKFEKYTIVQNGNKLILQNSKGKMVYKKINLPNALKSGSFLVGTWQRGNKNYKEKISFKPNGAFSCYEVDKINNTQTKASGTWVYQNKSVIITAFGCKSNGKHRLKANKNSLTLGEKNYKRIQ